jgi:D-methionine transport system permease protein
MEGFLNSIIPNIMNKLPDFYESIVDTLKMLGWSGSISFVLGLFLGVVLIVTRKGGILQNTVIYQILDKVINFFRSVPSI